MCARLLGVILFLSFSALAQKPRNYHNEATLLRKVILEQHFQPKAIHDEFSGQLFDQFLLSLDPDKLYFTDADLKPLLKFRTLLDDEINGTSWNFLNQFLPVYRQCVERSETLIQQLAQIPLTAVSKEHFQYDSVHWASDESALKDKWRLWLMFRTLDRLTAMKTEGESGIKFFNAHEKEARQRQKSVELRAIKRILNHPSGFENQVANIFFQTITSVFDPHSTYMPVTEMENFLASLSTEGYYFGVTLDEDERGDVVIAALAPGSPAWNCGELHAKDVLINLKWDGQEDIDMTSASVEEVNEILADANHNTIEFTVRKIGGLQKSVRLRKEKISMEQHFVRGYVLEGQKKIGYISLPDFYTQWGDEQEGSRCANDVAVEVMKLQKENIEGLILDVRFNGGGSLQEALALSGIFIDEGALGILKNKLQNAVTVKDLNRGTIYDGPLVVMVNGQSASASEFLAGALQDYNRAVIVGSQTFGKATAQNFFPLDPNQKEPSLNGSLDGLGFASITTDKIYRVTGRTAQGKGITPDVFLPDIFSVFNIRESSMPFALPGDSVSKKTYFKPLPPLPRNELRRQSEQRLKSDPAFVALNNLCLWVADEIRKEHLPILLSWESVEKEYDETLAKYKAMDEAITRVTALYEVKNSTTDQQRMSTDEYANSFNQTWIKRLQEDIYLAETFAITQHLIELKTKK